MDQFDCKMGDWKLKKVYFPTRFSDTFSGNLQWWCKWIMAEKMVVQINLIFLNGDVNKCIFQIVMHIDTLNTQYDADV